jgi:organic radical activating enzyme
MHPVALPDHYDYVAVYLTDRCPLRCSYCITEHNDTKFISGTEAAKRLTPSEWAQGLNRLRLPAGVPLTLQGGEPFVYPGIWELLELIEHPVDILTALPRNSSPEKWRQLSPAARARLNRPAPYPTMRVSYHAGQNKIEDLIERAKALAEFISIGIYTVDHPSNKQETDRARSLCEKAGILFKTKEYLGFHEGRLYGTYKYPEAASGKAQGYPVDCKNSVLILGPDGQAYRCHSDLYHKRAALSFGHLLDEGFAVKDEFRRCAFFGLCSECDVKVKNNHNQQFGYTSVTIRFPAAAAV